MDVTVYYVLCCAPLCAGGFPEVLDNLWLGQEEGEAVASALIPKLQKTKVAVEQLLFEVATLEVSRAATCTLHRQSLTLMPASQAVKQINQLHQPNQLPHQRTK